MRETPSIIFEIPVPWARKPMRISAKGLSGIVAAAVVTIACILILHCL